MIGFTIISFLLFAGFIALSAVLFGGIPASYSAFSARWAEEIPVKNVNVWSIVTALVAFLMLPPMIEAGVGNEAQALGFFAPLYLIVVSLTPGWETDPRQRRTHFIGTALCAVAALCWLFFVRHALVVFFIVTAACLAAAYFTKTLNSSKVFWGEMILFLSTYLALIV